MNEQTRITQRPQLQAASRPVELRPAAQIHGYGIAQPQGNSELEGLVRGLTAFNPALEKWHKQETEAATLAGAAAAQTNEAPRDALSGAELPLPEAIRPAYGKAYRDAFNEGLAQRAAVANKVDAITEYHTRKDEPDFNPTQWLAETRQKALTGVTDPRAQAIIGQHFTELELSIQGEAEKARLQQVEEANTRNVNAMLSDLVTVNQNPADLRASFEVFQTRARAAGKTNTEAAQMLMLHLANTSVRNGGAPEAFDVFTEKGKDGKSLLDYMPALGPQVEQLRQNATQAREKAIAEDVAVANEKVLAGLEERRLKDPMSITFDELLQHSTSHGALSGRGQAAHFWSSVLEQQQKHLGTQQTLSMAQSGQLYRLEAGKQNQVMDALFSPLMDRLVAANQAGDVGAVGQVAAQLLRAHSQAGATVAWDQLKGWTSRLTTTAQKEGPDAGFMAAKELYKAMSGTPKYRDLYFNEDVQKVMDSYIAGERAGGDPKVSYVQAFQSVSPEAKAAADAFARTPEFQKMVATESQKWVTGSSMNWLKLFGAAGRPQNGDFVSASLASEMRSWRARNPFASTDQAQAYAEQWTGKNFVMDTTSGSAVKVPPGYAPQAVQEAVSAHSAEIAKRMELAGRKDGRWTVQYIPTGTEGTFQPVLFDGSATQALPPVSVQSLLMAEKARKDFTREEAAAFGRYRKALANGEPLPVLDQALMAKAEMLGVPKPGELKAFRDTYQKQFTDRLNSTPQFSLGDPSAANLQFPQKGNVKIDNQLTSQVARELLGMPVMGPGQNHIGYAASLVTMGEAVALRRYADPASGAGDNIGMGYNLKANAKNAPVDLKRAGVPEDRIADVLNGSAGLTPEQAKRLLLVALPRYGKQAQEAAESASPGLWHRMLPAQKAVMIDVAWQTGNPEQFKRAWASLANGDTQAFTNETKVFYTDRNGTRREDTRRNNLRAAMLAGTAQWDATVNAFGKLPTTKLAAMGR